jgi:hypothetical protein
MGTTKQSQVIQVKNIGLADPTKAIDFAGFKIR